MKDKELYTARNKRLFERYYYWTEVVRMRPDDALLKVAREEFFIAEKTAWNVILKMVRSGETVEGNTLSLQSLKNSLFSGKKKPLTELPSLFG